MIAVVVRCPGGKFMFEGRIYEGSVRMPCGCREMDAWAIGNASGEPLVRHLQRLPRVPYAVGEAPNAATSGPSPRPSRSRDDGPEHGTP